MENLNKALPARFAEAEDIVRQIRVAHPDFDLVAENAVPPGWHGLLDAINPTDGSARYRQSFDAIKALLSVEHQHLLFELDDAVGIRMFKQEDALHAWYRTVA